MTVTNPFPSIRLSVTPYPTLKLKLTQPDALQMRFLPAIPGFNASSSAAAIADAAKGPTPATSTDNAITRWDGTTGRLLQNSVSIVEDNGEIVSLGLGAALTAIDRTTQDKFVSLYRANGFAAIWMDEVNDVLLFNTAGRGAFVYGLQEAAVALADGPTVALNAQAGNLFYLAAAGDRTILVPSNAPAAGQTQKMIIRHMASGGARTLALTTGAGGFRFGTTITALTQTLSGKTDYIGCLWNLTDSRWDVVAYAKGF